MSSSAVPFDALDAYAEIVRLYSVAGRTHAGAIAGAREVVEGLVSGFSLLEDDPAPPTAPPVFPSAPGPVLRGVTPLPDSDAVEALSVAMDATDGEAARVVTALSARGIVLVRDAVK